MIAQVRRRVRAGSLPAVCALLALLALSPAAVGDDSKTQSVELVVDFGDGAQVRLAGLAWREKMTVVDAMETAQKHPHGIQFSARGSGTSTLITQIDDVKNEGAGKNWLYSINGKLSNVGAGAYELKPGDRILWEFKVYE